jgi:hypothetical protein
LVKSAISAVCSRLSITDFDRVYTLKEMVDHIYGRLPVKLPKNRPNLFIRELSLYIAYLKGQLTKKELNVLSIPDKYFDDFTRGLLGGVRYYRQMSSQLASDTRAAFLLTLADLESQIPISPRGQNTQPPDRNGPFSEAASTESV